MTKPKLKTCPDCQEQHHARTSRCPDCADKHKRAKQRAKAEARRSKQYKEAMDTYFALMRDEHCGCCGCPDTRVLGFYRPDTMDPFTIGKTKTMTLDEIRTEASKCKVYCANCHRIARTEVCMGVEGE